MKKGLKIAGIVIGSLLILLLVTPMFLTGKIEQIVKREGATMLNAKLDFEKLNISLIRHFPYASVDLKNLSIEGIGDFEGDTLVQARRIAVVVDVMSLFGDSFEVTKMILDAPQINAMKLADGKVNWDIMKDTGEEAATDTTTTAESSFKLTLKDLRINDGRLVFIDDSSKMQFYAQNLGLRLRGDMTADRTDLSLRLNADGLYYVMDKMAMLSNAEVSFDARIIADLANSKFTFDKNTLKLNAIEVGIDGWVAMPDDAIDMDIKLATANVQFKDVLSMIPAFYTKDFKNLSASGALSLDAWAKGRMEGENFPAFGASLSVKDGKFKYADLPKSVDNIQIAASVAAPAGGSLDNVIVDVPTFSLSMAGQNLSASFHATTPVSDMNFRAAAKGAINLGMIKEVYPLGDSITLSGNITADLRAAGRMSDIEKELFEKIDAQGTFTVQDMNAAVKGLPEVKISRASASISPAAMTLREFFLNVGNSDIAASGQLTNYLAYALKNDKLTGRLNVTSKLLDLNELMGNTSAETPETTADTSALTAIEIPKNLDLNLTTSLEKILFQKMTITNLNGEVSVSDGTLDMKKLTMNALGGKMSASGRYSTATSPLTPDLEMVLGIDNASFSQSFKELEMIQKLVPLFEKTGGNYSMSLDMKTRLLNDMSPELNTLNAKGNISSQNIHLQNIKAFDVLATTLKDDRLKKIEAKDVNISFTISDGKIYTKPFDLKMGVVNLNMSGTTGLDQSIDYTANVTLPEGTAGGYVGKIPVNITGTFTAPKITLGIKEMAQDAIKNAIQKEVTEKLLDGKDLKEELNKQAETLREEARAAGEKLIQAAREQGDKLIEKAKNPIEKIAAKKGADVMVKEAEKQAQKLTEKTEQQIEALQNKINQ